MLSASLCSDILAIRCINEYVCIGAGNYVDVYHSERRETVAKLKVFENDNIHDIVKGPSNELFIFGGKNLSICEFLIDENTVKLKLYTVERFHDWIIALAWNHHENSTSLSILFAHNSLKFYEKNSKKAHTLQCQEQCILYGGSLLAKREETIVFSGTVFQEILIWQAKNNLQYSNNIAVLHRLKGHKGVIFSVSYDLALRTITSTSDDRTVRLWKIEKQKFEDGNEINWNNCKIDLTTTMYGHTARVWRSIIREKKVISIGEDSLMCIWSLDGELLDKIEIHNGSEIWSIDVSENNENIFTGGADGAVNVWPFESPIFPQERSIYTNDEKKNPKYVFYTQSRNILIFIDGGYLIHYCQEFGKLSTIFNSFRFSSYSVMQISPDRKKIALGSKDGYLEIYEEIFNEENWTLRKTLERKITESKIFSLHWLDNGKIIVCGDSGNLWIIDRVAETEEMGLTFILPACRERWTTAAIIFKNFLVCGDRAGSIYVYSLDHRNPESLPKQIFSKIHGRLGVQSFTISANKLLSTGRDGTLRFYEFDDHTQQLKSLHPKKMPMDWVCKVLEDGDDLYVMGFKEVEIMVYSMSLKRIVNRYACGGGHRSWDCKISNGKMNFLYIRDKRVYDVNSNLRNTSPPIKKGFHTKEIYSVECLKILGDDKIFLSASEDCTLRLSCIVEEKSNIQRYSVETLDTYDSHISNVKCLATFNLEKNEKFTRSLVVSGGGRAQLKIWEIRVMNEDRVLTNNSVTCRELLSYMLRGTDKDRKKHGRSNEPAFFVDPETRFMDLKIQSYENDPNLAIIFVACSDGYLRTFVYDITKNILLLSPSVNYCNRCTLKIETFVHESQIILMSMTTDGFVRFWQMNSTVENLVENSIEKMNRYDEEANVPFANIKIHQSGINSSDFRRIDPSTWILLTGGDDNLLSLVVIEISSRNNKFFANLLTTWNSSSIHAAQITGAKFVDCHRMLSTGIDQKICVYSYSYVDGSLSVSQLEEKVTLVSDVQGVTLCESNSGFDERLVFVYGKGFEVIVLTTDSSIL
ncbi:WD repeat-containing protein 6 [Venturia canescens]|uniref:WD repeat-containing protein 6 n=1 Tax=Venturia canescens TaxID=32260 RepID=UPI001C9C673C|nr:WD repeat-containing protein 6 [Venturia canescens]